jgi:hypothetical protein
MGYCIGHKLTVVSIVEHPYFKLYLGHASCFGCTYAHARTLYLSLPLTPPSIHLPAHHGHYEDAPLFYPLSYGPPRFSNP